MRGPGTSLWSTWWMMSDLQGQTSWDCSPNITKSATREAQGFFQFFHDLIDNRTGKRPINHSQGAEHELRLVKIWIAAAIGWTVLIYAATIVFQERTRGRACRPGIIIERFRAFQVCLNELLPCHGKTARQPIEFLFAESRVHFPAAIGALGTVDSGPHSAGSGKDALVDLLRLQTALGFQEETELVILVFFFLSLRAYLDKIESHCVPHEEFTEFPIWKVRNVCKGFYCRLLIIKQQRNGAP